MYRYNVQCTSPINVVIPHEIDRCYILLLIISTNPEGARQSHHDAGSSSTNTAAVDLILLPPMTDNTDNIFIKLFLYTFRVPRYKVK